MRSVPILLYHRVDDVPPERDPLGLVVSPAQFAEQMDYLHKNNYHCLPLGTVVKVGMSGKRAPRRTFSITFDDGSKDLYDQALPALRRHGFTATVFLVVVRVGGETDWEGQSGDLAFPLLSWGEIREMERQNIQFGSHSRTHPRLGNADDEQVIWEACSSKQIIEEELGHPIELFAYPYEDFTATTLKLVEQCGYLGACGSSRLPESRFNLWRAEVFAHDSLSSFAFKMSRGWRLLTGFKRQARALRAFVNRPFGK